MSPAPVTADYNNILPGSSGSDAIAQPYDPLASLPPLALPEPISWWPPAPGWWLLGAMAIGLVITCLYLLIRHWRARRDKRLFLRELATIFASSDRQESQTESDYYYLLEATQLIRRFCLQRQATQPLATEYGEQWLENLDRLAGKKLLRSDVGRQLLQLYQPSFNIDRSKLQLLLTQWIKAVPAALPSR